MPTHPARSPSAVFASTLVTVLRGTSALAAMLDGAKVYLNKLPPKEYRIVGDSASGLPLRYLVLTDSGESFRDHFDLDVVADSSITIHIFALNVALGDGSDYMVRSIYGAIVPALHNAVLNLGPDFVMIAPGTLSRSLIVDDPPSGGTHGVCRYEILARTA